MQVHKNTLQVKLGHFLFQASAWKRMVDRSVDRRTWRSSCWRRSPRYSGDSNRKRDNYSKLIKNRTQTRACVGHSVRSLQEIFATQLRLARSIEHAHMQKLQMSAILDHKWERRGKRGAHRPSV